MNIKDIFTKLKNKFNDNILELIETEQTGSDSFINVSPVVIKDVAMFLRDDDAMQFNYLSFLSGMDYKDSLGVVYHLYSMKHKHALVIKTKLSYENPKISSVEKIWKTADWHEREAYDMFGIIFDGHHNLERILCPEDWVYFPLRKDYVAPTEYHGIDATPNK